MKRENVFVPLYKKCNNGTNEKKFKLIKDGELEVPRYIDVELTNYCNLHCRMCPTGTNTIGVERGFMSERVMDEICKNVLRYHIKGVRCIGWGEPTIHKNFWIFLKRIKETGAYVHFNTNGMTLSCEDVKRIVAEQIESIKFSFQGTDRESYSEMRVGGDWDRLLNVIRSLIRERGAKEYPFVQITTTLTNETGFQVKQFEELVEGMCDYYNIGRTELSHLIIDDMDISEKDKEKIRRLKKTESIEKRHFYPCPDAFDHFQIMWNGNVTLCCNDYGNGLVIGNVLNEDFREIFVGRRANRYRKMIIEEGYESIEMCSKCYEWAPLIR